MKKMDHKSKIVLSLFIYICQAMISPLDDRTPSNHQIIAPTRHRISSRKSSNCMSLLSFQAPCIVAGRLIRRLRVGRLVVSPSKLMPFSFAVVPYREAHPVHTLNTLDKKFGLSRDLRYRIGPRYGSRSLMIGGIVTVTPPVLDPGASSFLA